MYGCDVYVYVDIIYILTNGVYREPCDVGLVP